MPLLLQFINRWSKVNPLCCYSVLGAGECSQRLAFASHLDVLSREQDKTSSACSNTSYTVHTTDDRNSEGEDTCMFVM